MTHSGLKNPDVVQKTETGLVYEFDNGARNRLKEIRHLPKDP